MERDESPGKELDWVHLFQACLRQSLSIAGPARPLPPQARASWTSERLLFLPHRTQLVTSQLVYLPKEAQPNHSHHPTENLADSLRTSLPCLLDRTDPGLFLFFQHPCPPSRHKRFRKAQDGQGSAVLAIGPHLESTSDQYQWNYFC